MDVTFYLENIEDGSLSIMFNDTMDIDNVMHILRFYDDVSKLFKHLNHYAIIEKDGVKFKLEVLK